MAVSLLDPRNGEPFDLAPAQVPSRTYIVASTPRTGSTLLCRLLWDTGRVGAPKEYLNPMQVRDWELRLGASGLRRLFLRCLRGPAVGLVGQRHWHAADLQRYIDGIRQRRTHPDGLFGLKLHRHHFEKFFVSGDASLARVLEPQKWIHVQRTDRIAQAVSWSRALQSGRWAAHQRFALPVVYRRRQIQRLVAVIARQEAAWEDFFMDQGLSPLRIRYEDLVADRESVLRKSLDFLGVPDANVLPIPEPGLVRQSDHINHAWIERYRREA